MSEQPPPSRPPEPLSFDPRRAGDPSERDKATSRRNEPPGEPRSRLRSEAPPAANRSNKPPAPATGRDLERDLIGRTVGGRYLIKGILGEGGMGTVFDAEHLGLSRQVAIKVLSPSQAKKKVAVKRFQQEARAAGAIGHPNICEVYDLGVLDDGSPYLVMEKLVGQTLSDRIANEGGLPFDEVVDIVGQVLSGLIAAHEKGIVHRDIKPENIFLARRLGCPPIIKLLDFGVSKMMAEFQTSDDALDLTRTGMVMGTPYYMAPEQARGERNLDGRVDVYACGVVMYEAITGKRPFLAPNYNALLLAIINTSPRGIREVRPATPPELEAIILRAMQKGRADRYASAKDMLRELVPPIAEGSSANQSSSPPNAAHDDRRRAPVPATTSMRREGRDKPPAPPFDPLRRKPAPLPDLDDDSVDIPIHITNVTGLDELAADEGPTAVFQSGKPGLQIPPPAPRQPGRESAPPPPPLKNRPLATPKAPLLPRTPPASPDWEGETVVKPGAPPFNPEQTMKIEGGELDRLENRHAPPRRR